MDAWFPWAVLFCGAWLRMAVTIPQVRDRMERMNPIPGAVIRCKRASVIFLIVGALWGFQNLF